MRHTITAFLIATVLLLWGYSVQAGGATINFAWEQSQESLNLPDFGGWNIYMSDNEAGPWAIVSTINYDPSSITTDFVGEALLLPDGTKEIKYFMARSFNKASGAESANSDTVSKEIDLTNPMPVPINFRLPIEGE